MKFRTLGFRRTPLARRRGLYLAATILALLGVALPAQAATFTVLNNNDSGVGSLRQAINDANNTAGADTIVFNVASFTIAPIIAFPAITGPVTIDGTTQPGYAGTPIIVLDGSLAGAGVDGLPVRAPNCVIRGLTIQNFSGNGISIAGATVTGCSVTGCRIGTNSAGTVAAANNNGVAIFNGADNNTVGGTTAATMNVISGNTSNGVLIFGVGTTGNSVLGNRIGTNAAGTAAVGNGAGVIIFQGAQNNSIGSVDGVGNLISGNTGSGVQIFDPGTTGNQVHANQIGINAAGSAALANGSHGIQIFDQAANNFIGGPAPNTISGNNTNGVLINDAGTTGNVVAGNRIGTNSSGGTAIPNGNAGVQIQNGADANTIGGSGPGRNIISGNGDAGVKILGAGTTTNTVRGNYIGLAITGTGALPNDTHGVEITNGATNNLVGGPQSGDGNIISGNFGAGVAISGTGSNSNQVQGNRIGTNAAGTSAIGNGTAVTPREGVYINDGAQNNIVSNINVISGNTGNGVTISGDGTTGNHVFTNRIGTNFAGDTALANGIHGVEVRNGATGNTIGRTLANGGAENTIAFNTRDGVRVSATSNTATIRGNRIFQNGELGINLSGGTEDANNVNSNDGGDADTGANLRQNYPVLSTASLAGNTVSLTGTLNSTPNTTFIIDFYSNTVADPSGAGEGQLPIGLASVTTNASGNANISFSNTVSGQPAFITATATDPAGNTSEFSLARAVTVVPTFSISGRLTNSNGGAGIAGVAVALGGNITDSVTTNANGDYVFNGLTAGNYTVTPSASAGYSFTPASRNVTITNANVGSQNFTGVATSARIIGRISDSNGVAIPGVTVTRSGSATPVTTNSAGYYVLTGVTPGTYTVTPSRTGFTFTPVTRSVAVSGGDVTGQNFIGRSGPPPAATYRIIGRIGTSNGTGVAGVSVTRTGSATPVTTNSAGYYVFNGVPNGTYTVTPSRPGYVFSPLSRSVTVNGADSIDNSFVAATGYRILGRIATSSGIAVAGVTVTRSGSATPVTTNSAGYYTFENVPNGSYVITPSQSGRTFTPPNRTATVNSADTSGNNFIASG